MSNIEGIEARLAKVIELFPSRAAAGEAVRKTPKQLWRYATGRSEITLEMAKELADAQDVSLDWLATGRGPMYRSEREERMGILAEPSDDGEGVGFEGRRQRMHAIEEQIRTTVPEGVRNVAGERLVSLVRDMIFWGQLRATAMKQVLTEIADKVQAAYQQGKAEAAYEGIRAVVNNPDKYGLKLDPDSKYRLDIPPS